MALRHRKESVVRLSQKTEEPEKEESESKEVQENVEE